MARTWITINAEADRAIRSATLPGHGIDHSGSRQLANGDWSIEVDEDTRARLLSMAFPGETFSDTIIRATAAYHAKGRQN